MQHSLNSNPLRKETPFSDTVYRSLSSNMDNLRPTSLSYASNFDSDLSRPTFRSLIDSSPSSNIFPTHEVPSKKSSPFVSRDIQIQSSAFSKEISVEPPLAPGGYLEPFYHFVSHAKPAHLFDLISETLHSLLRQKLICHAIDIELIPRKFKVKCVAYPPGELKLQFVCRVFRLDSDEQGKRYALEFQRRSGCVLQFSDLWTKCKQIFQDTGFMIADKKCTFNQASCEHCCSSHGCRNSSNFKMSFTDGYIEMLRCQIASHCSSL